MNPIFSFLNHPASPPWSHPHVTLHHKTKNSTPTLITLKNLTDTTIFLSSTPFHIPKVYLHVFAIYNASSLIIYNYCTASTPMHSLLLATTSSLKRVGDCLEQQGISMFYFDTGLPTLNCNNKIICKFTHTNTFLNSLDDTMSNNPFCFLTGHWFLKHWADAQTVEWLTPAVKATFQATLTVTQTIHKPLSECLLEDWRSSWTALLPGDQCRHFTPLGEPPDLHLHCYVYGLCLPLQTYLLVDKWLIVRKCLRTSLGTPLCISFHFLLTY